VIRCVLLCMMEGIEGRLCSLEVLEVLEVMRCVLLCKLEAVAGGFCLLEVPEVIRCVLLCMVEGMEGRLCSLDVLEVPEVPRCVLLCMLEAVGGRVLFAGSVEGDALCLLCTLEVVEGVLCSLEVPEVMRRVLLCMLEVVEVPEMMRCVLRCILEASVCRRRCAVCYFVYWRLWRVGFCSSEVMRCVLLCMLEAVEGELSFHLFPQTIFIAIEVSNLSLLLMMAKFRLTMPPGSGPWAVPVPKTNSFTTSLFRYCTMV